MQLIEEFHGSEDLILTWLIRDSSEFRWVVKAKGRREIVALAVEENV